MEEILVSCIVPVYNVEKYLEQCIESIVKQTHQNIEIILIDDGSTDSSSEICDRWKEKDSRIRVIHKENGGAAVARNLGIKQMRGEWFVFIDSDDYIHPQYIELLLRAVKKDDALLACCSYESFSSEPVQIFETYELKSEQIILPEKKENFYQFANNLVIMPWNKIYHSSLFENFTFYEGKINEDVGLSFYLVGTIKKYSKISIPLYYYRDNEGGVTKGIKSMRQMDIIDVSMRQYDYFLRQQQVEYASLILKTCIDFFPGLYCDLKESKKLDKKIFIRKYKKIYKLILKDRKIEWKVIWKHCLYIRIPFSMSLLKKS